MKNPKKIAIKLLSPPIWLLLLLIPVSVLFLIIGLSESFGGTAVAYVSYAVSAYTLTAVIIASPKLIGNIKKGVSSHHLIVRLKSNKWVRMFLDDISFRSTALIYQGFVTNLIYAVFRQITALVYGSVWFGAIAVYYTFLCVVKLFLIRRAKKAKRFNDNERKIYEYKSYGLCGGLMILLNAGMAGIIIMMIRQNQHFEYPGFIIYLSAAYTFYVVITAVINVFKFRKLNSPLLSASKAITLVSAMMSLMVLQTALISQFGADDITFRNIANNITGTAVCLLSLGVAIYMSVRTWVMIHKLKDQT